jgi:hypothetical protein
MEEVQGFIVLLDISGYTRYVRAHNLRFVPFVGKSFQTTGEAHAEAVVTDLLETLINATSDILKPEKLEGDAVLLTAVVDEPDRFSRVLVERLQQVFAAFHKRLDELRFCETCLCDCCSQMAQLRVKAIAHHGPFLLKTVAGFREIAGQEVIRAHRLLKNKVQSDEYLMLTEPVVVLSDASSMLTMDSHTEVDKDLGETNVWVYFPEGSQVEQATSEEGYLARFNKMRAYFSTPRDRAALVPAAK